MRKKRFIIILTLAFAIGIRLFSGIYIHDEFEETHFFIKHRPIWKWRFYSPIGVSDLKFDDLSREAQKEQLFYNEFIRDRGLSR